jgi:hypothetical protein
MDLDTVLSADQPYLVSVHDERDAIPRVRTEPLAHVGGNRNSPAAAKEIPQQLAAFGRKETAGAVGTMVESGVRRQQVEDAAARAAFGVCRPEQDPSDARMYQRPGAHGAGLQGDVERRAW